jgi:hypothetical protein
LPGEPNVTVKVERSTENENIRIILFLKTSNIMHIVPEFFI